MPSNPTFRSVWLNDSIRKQILTLLSIESRCALRLTSSECCDLTTMSLFTRIRLTFTPSALRSSRLEALSRIGMYIEHLTFEMSHSDATFLPPLLNPVTGREVTFLYTPYTSMASVLRRPKYGSWELGNILTSQYPPIFHAATNVPAFITALSHLPNLRHLTISCQGQDPAQRYRRSSVDYALISLRIAIERSPLPHLEKLSLSRIHPSALLYLRHRPGFGSTPSAARRWRQIRKLAITMDSWDFFGSSPGLDHLKILDDYVRNMSPVLEKLSFGWNGRKGPCPLTLWKDPLFLPKRLNEKLFGEVTSPMSPLPPAPPRKAMRFPKLRYLQVRNVSLSEQQVADLVLEHRHTTKEFDFENVSLTQGGSWENALAPLTRLSGHNEWSSQRSGSEAASLRSASSQQEVQYAADEVVETIADMLRDTSVQEIVQVKKKKLHRRRKRTHQRKDSGIALSISIPYSVAEPDVQLLQPMAFDPHVQGNQRNFAQEAARQELAEDPEKRMSALRMARDTVLRQLGKEFCKKGGKDGRGLFKGACARKGKVGSGESNTALVPILFSRC